MLCAQRWQSAGFKSSSIQLTTNNARVWCGLQPLGVRESEESLGYSSLFATAHSAHCYLTAVLAPSQQPQAVTSPEPSSHISGRVCTRCARRSPERGDLSGI